MLSRLWNKRQEMTEGGEWLAISTNEQGRFKSMIHATYRTQFEGRYKWNEAFGEWEKSRAMEDGDSDDERKYQ